MPLLTSPIDGSPMKQIKRYGIEIDICPTTGGIWLDKGELEKLMVLLKEEAMNDQPAAHRQGHEERHSRQHYDYDDHDDDDDRHHRGYDRSQKRKGKMSRIMDIFDF